MTVRDEENPNVTRARDLASKQAADLVNMGALTPGEVVELYVGVGVGVALMFSTGAEIAVHLRQIADDAEAGVHLQRSH